MGRALFLEQPFAVGFARAIGDKEALSAMGRAGNRKKRARMERRQLEDEAAAVIASERAIKYEREEEERRRNANEHIIPPETYD